MACYVQLCKSCHHMRQPGTIGEVRYHVGLSIARSTLIFVTSCGAFQWFLTLFGVLKWHFLASLVKFWPSRIWKTREFSFSQIILRSRSCTQKFFLYICDSSSNSCNDISQTLQTYPQIFPCSGVSKFSVLVKCIGILYTCVSGSKNESFRFEDRMALSTYSFEWIVKYLFCFWFDVRS